MFWWILLGLAFALFLLVRARPSAHRWRDPRPEAAQRAQAGRGLDVAELARRLDVDAGALAAVQPGYRSVEIPKRSGGRRTLQVPDDLTKELQRRILHRLLRRLRAHAAACGFERGRSIVSNALPHVGQAVVIRLDVVDFFPSTRADRLDAYFRRIGWDEAAAALLVRLTTHDGGLPQGAPTSPRLSNLVNYRLDVQIGNAAARRRGVYTRYADDITLSFPRDYPQKMRGVVQKVRRILKAHGYTVHKRRKFSLRRRHQRQCVTGLVVNDKVSLPRRTRRWLRAVRHHAAGGRAATLTPEQLAGWAALETMVERQAAGRDG